MKILNKNKLILMLVNQKKDKHYQIIQNTIIFYRIIFNFYQANNCLNQLKREKNYLKIKKFCKIVKI